MREDVRNYRTQHLPVSSEVWCIWSGLVVSVLLSTYFFVGQFGGFVQSEVFIRDTINPNTASAASLLRLSGIGRVRAEAIVSYRESNGGSTSGGPVFENLSDLERVKGIGPKTVEKMRGYMDFEQGVFCVEE